MTDAALPSRREFAERLRQETLACRLERSQFGTSRKVSDDQKERMAELFGADAARLAANKKLLNKRHEAYLAVTSALNRARDCWMDNTVPYPEPGLRLIKREKVEDFDRNMQAIKADLDQARLALELVYQNELIPDARERLGDLFNSSDYPMEISGEFAVAWAFTNVDPPEYLRGISPRLYQQMEERVQARFEEALALTEAAFVEEFTKMVNTLVERLTPSPDGKKRVIKDSSVENLNEFFQKFRSLSIGSNGDLDAIVEEAQRAIRGVDVKALRKDVTVQGQIRATMADLAGRLDALQVDRPTRKITLGDETIEQASEAPPAKCINCGAEITAGSQAVGEATGDASLGETFQGRRLCQSCTSHEHFGQVFPNASAGAA
jgi:hypothetical protein